MARSVVPLLLAVLLAAAEPTWAKRPAAKPIVPVVYKGITYSAPNHDGETGYVVASDSSGRELFRIKVFEVPIDPKLETDVQWVFITELKLRGVGSSEGRTGPLFCDQLSHKGREADVLVPVLTGSRIGLLTCNCACAARSSRSQC